MVVCDICKRTLGSTEDGSDGFPIKYAKGWKRTADGISNLIRLNCICANCQIRYPNCALIKESV